MLSAARPVQRAAVLLAAAALTTLPAVVPAGAAAPADPGQASAVTAELDLDVSLLNSAVDVPVDIALNKVSSPAEQRGSMLSANVAGVAQPGPVTLLKADVGSSVTHLDAQGASAAVRLLNADVHAPGLPATTLLGLQALGTSVSCPVDGQPTATVDAPASLSVLGHQVNLRLNGPTHVAVPAIGTVDIEFSQRSATSTTAAAAALSVKVSINPLNLNVAKVDGTITVASVSCRKPGGSASPSSTASAAAPPAASAPAVPTTAARVAAATPAATPTTDPATPTSPAHPAGRAADPALAFTGNTSVIPLGIAGAALLVLGSAAVLLARRRRPGHRR